MAYVPVSAEPRPVLVWDGECGFCKRCVLWIRSRVGEGLECVPYQELGERFPELDRAACAKAVQLVEGNGKITQGAEACYRAMSLAAGWGWPLFLHRFLPGFDFVSEVGYSLVARNRTTVSRLSKVVAGPDPEASTWVWSRRIFLSLLGVVYLIAFGSFWVQADVLVGSQGIFPIESTYNQLGALSWLDFPSVFWLGYSDGFLNAVCAVGCVLALLLCCGIAPRLALVLLWVGYLSLTHVGGIFMGYQWEGLLLETGLLAVFLAPGGLRPGVRWQVAPSTLARLLLLWLLFRLLLRSGVVKLMGGDSVWSNLTALEYHYWTQPLPTWTSYWVDHLPDWLHRVSTLGMFAIELVLPFLIFGARRLRKIAFLGSAMLQLAIMVTGNYGFFNLNTLALCVLLLDDQTLARLLPRSRRCFAGFGVSPQGWRRWGMPPVAALMFSLSVLVTFVATVLPPAGGHPAWLLGIHNGVRPFRAVNYYGLFANMTTTRPELVIQGSADGTSWHAYEFHWKPGRVDRRPAFVQPHMPRVDWQMWFSALAAESIVLDGFALTDPEVPEQFRAREAWLSRLLGLLVQGKLDTLFVVNPFAEQPPRYVRVVMYEYQFTDTALHSETGDWWERLLMGLYIPPQEIVEGQLVPARF